MTSADDVLTGLDDDQVAAVHALHGPVAILAGAGSGKTRVITHRIAYGVLTGSHDPARSVAVTFTTKAAGEMTRRLAALGVPQVRVRTFHAAALRQLRHYYPRVLKRDLPDVTAVKAPLLAASAGSMNIPAHAAAVRDYASEVEWAKVNSIAPARYGRAAADAGRQPPAGLSTSSMAELFAEYERRKTAAGRIDFEDVLLLMVALVESEPQVARHLRSGLRHITVDEYQDVSALQQRLLDGWLGDNDNLCVVGDPAQTIYSFAGADPSHLTGFSGRYPGATVVRLPRTYRCTPEIAASASSLMAAGGDALTLVSQRPSGVAVRLHQYPDAHAEAAAVADRIAELHRGGLALRDIAILVRMNAMTEPLEEALADRGIGYSITGGTGFFHRAEVRKAIAVIRGAAMATARNNDPAAGSADDVSATVGALLAGLGWTQQAPLGSGAVRDRWESWAALHAAAVEFAAVHPEATLIDFAEDLKERAERQDAPDGTGVTLASLHAAKGAEWPCVFLVGVNEGVLPHSSATSPEQLAEERRLFYVGITRAADRLDVSTAGAKAPGGRTRKPSRFLDDLPRSVTGQVSRPASAGSAAGSKKRRARGPAACRVCGKGLVTGAERAVGRCRTCPGDVDLALLERLRQWRTDAAAQLAADRGKDRVPSYLVATDATLQAIAEQQPTSLTTLAAIPGIGERKIDDYGEELLAVVQAATRASASSGGEPAPTAPERRSQGSDVP